MLPRAGGGLGWLAGKGTQHYALPMATSGLVCEYVSFMTEHRLWPVLEAGQPRFLFPVVRKDKKGFSGARLATSRVTVMLQHTLRALGEAAEPTSHSLKRTALARSPLTDSEMAACISLSESTIRLYRDRMRG